ncbi:MAG TPA: DUF3147 family protein [Bryobacteraceae bacterium]|nr:DUF3147 family protein [Bryobacteraceae bacterium]
MDPIARFLIGGLAVSVFSLLGDLLKPKSFAGLFGAAPSVALATLGLAIAHQGPAYARIECRSMAVGAVALGAYSLLVCRLLIRGQLGPAAATLASLAAWFAGSFGLWLLFLR